LPERIYGVVPKDYQWYVRPLVYADTRPQPAVPEGWTIRLQKDGRIYFSAPSGARGSIKRRLPKDDEPISDSTLDRAFFDLCSDLLSTPTTLQPEGDGWIKCSERLPTEACEALLDLGGKVVNGAWIAESFWYSNAKVSPVAWMHHPKPISGGSND
jgi:hypothetical protein